MMTFLAQASEWLQAYYSELSVALVTTLLVIYGDVLNKHIKRALKPYHFILRTFLFVIICTFGYSSLVLVLSPVVVQGFKLMPWPYFPILITVIAIVIGVLAEKRRYI